jgi:hypothetical protein
MTAEEHDRQAGRQLAWLLLVVTALAIGGSVWLPRSETSELGWWLVAIPVVLVSATALAFLRPVAAIRLVSGRLDELWDVVHPASQVPARDAQEVRAVLTSLQEGNPAEVVAAERLVKSSATRGRLGKVLMVAGLLLLVPAIVLMKRLPEEALTVPPGLFVSGLIPWYRTL